MVAQRANSSCRRATVQAGHECIRGCRSIRLLQPLSLQSTIQAGAWNQPKDLPKECMALMTGTAVSTICCVNCRRLFWKCWPDGRAVERTGGPVERTGGAGELNAARGEPNPGAVDRSDEAGERSGDAKNLNGDLGNEPTFLFTGPSTSPRSFSEVWSESHNVRTERSDVGNEHSRLEPATPRSGVEPVPLSVSVIRFRNENHRKTGGKWAI